MDIGSTFSGLVPSGSVVGLIILLIVIGIVVLAIVGLIGFLAWNRKRWYLKVEIKLPRSDGQIVNGEWGKGFFSSKQGVVYIKRPGIFQKKIPLKIFDPKRYLQGSDMMTVIQLSPTDYRPVLPKSFLEYEVEYECDRDYNDSPSLFLKLPFVKRPTDEQISNLKKGDVVMVKETVMNMECDTGASKAWQTAFEAAAKKAYSLQSFMTQFQTPIAIAIVLIAVFVGIAALWTQMPG